METGAHLVSCITLVCFVTVDAKDPHAASYNISMLPVTDSIFLQFERGQKSSKMDHMVVATNSKQRSPTSYLLFWYVLLCQEKVAV